MKLLKQYVSITLGCALMALAFDWFYAPNELTLGSFTGIAQVINFFVPALPVGVTVIVLNAPLFLMSLKALRQALSGALILRRGGELDLHRPHQRRLYLSADG